MIDYENINEKIAPFSLLVYDEDPKNVRGSLIYYPDGEYRQEVFDIREDEGAEGNGYDWESLALLFLEEKMPELSDAIDFDPEGSMFCAYSSKVDALAKFSLEFKEFCDDIEAMKDLFSRAELDQLTKIVLNFWEENRKDFK